MDQQNGLEMPRPSGSSWPRAASEVTETENPMGPTGAPFPRTGEDRNGQEGVPERVVRLRKVMKEKTAFDGFGGLLWFILYSCISGIIPALLMDFYDGVYRSNVNQAMSAYTDYNGDDW